MTWELNSDRPVYLQLVEHLQLAVISGEFAPGSRVPSVRELAAEAAVNPNTMQKALAELESEGLVQTQRTSGHTVTTDVALITGAKKALAGNVLEAFFHQMKKLGYTPEQACELVCERRSSQQAATLPCDTAQRKEDI